MGKVGRAVGASRGHLAEVFREVVGVSPYRYQLQLRLARAQELLMESDDLAQLALDLGFSSHSHFTTAFRHRFGETPAHFRARIRRE
jgi:AraC-like DNA-binding protein